MADPLELQRLTLEDPLVIEKLTEVDPSALEKLKALTSLSHDIDNVNINLHELRRRCPLDQTSSRSLIPPLNAKALPQSLGLLDILPLETLQNIFSQLDLQTLTDLRSVSRRTLLAVDSIPEYREIVTHVPDTLRALLSTNLARHILPSHVTKELHSQDCYLCGSFGGFLFLPDCARCCLLCLLEDDDTLPISRAQAKESFELTNESLSAIPTMFSLPGSYGFKLDGSGRVRDTLNHHKRRTRLVSMGLARTAARRLHGDQKVSESFMGAPRQIWMRAYALRPPRAFSIQSTRVAKPPFPPYARGPRYVSNEPRRLMSAIRFPTLDSTTGRTEWGIFCIGCYRRYRDGLTEGYETDEGGCISYQRMYTKMGFLDHFKECKWAQRLWKKHKRPTYIMVHKMHLQPETLDAYDLPWEWHKDDADYIIIKCWIPEPDQDILFEHTRMLGVPEGRWKKEIRGLDKMEMSGFNFRVDIEERSRKPLRSREKRQ